MAITNDDQLARTKRWIERFAKAVAEFPLVPPHGTHPMIHAAQLEGMKSQVEDLQLEVTEYQRSKA